MKKKYCKCGCKEIVTINSNYCQGHNPSSQFKKGNIPHNKGKTKENYKPLKTASENISKTRIEKKLSKGRNHPMFGKFGKDNPNYGQKRPSMTGDNNPAKRKEVRTRMSITRKINPSRGMLGKKNPRRSEMNKERKGKSYEYLYGKNNTMKIKEKQRISRIKYIEKCLNNGEPITPTIGINETKILNELENLYKYKIVRQHHIKNLGYIVDGYIPELNLIIEVDEKKKFDNSRKLKEKHVIRQRNIEEVGFKFLRVEDRF